MAHTKIGRNIEKCKIYRLHDKRKKNKLRKLKRIMKGFRTDKAIIAIQKVIDRIKAA